MSDDDHCSRSLLTGAANQLQTYYLRLDAGDVDGAVALFASDAVFVPPAWPIRGGGDGVLRAVRGRDAIRERFVGPREDRHAIRVILSDGQYVLAEGIVVPKGMGSPRPFLASAVLDRHGLIARYMVMASPAESETLVTLEATSSD
jgi:ketosteroid isomerase-like protein